MSAGSLLGPTSDEVVEHHLAPVEAVTFGDELGLARSVINEKRVGIPSHADLESLSGADRDHPHVDPGLLSKERNDVAEQARLLGGDRGSEGDEAVLGAGGERKKAGESKKGAAEHKSSFR